MFNNARMSIKKEPTLNYKIILNIKEKNNTWMILSEKIFIHHIKQKKLEKNTNKSKKR